MDITYVYSKLRKEFGRHVVYKKREAEVLLDIQPNPDDGKDVWETVPIAEKGVQASYDVSEHTVEPVTVAIETTTASHTQGGWPKDIEPTDAEHTSRYRKKVERDGNYAQAVKASVDRLDTAVQLNNAMDLTERYFEDADGSAAPLHAQPPTVKVISVFRDPSSIKRSARRVAWAPDSSSKAPRKFAASFCNMTYQYDISLNRALLQASATSKTLSAIGDTGISAGGSPENILGQYSLQTSSSYIYDVGTSSTPDFELMAPNSSSNSAITSIKYSTKDSHILFAGLYNGTVGYYDTRRSHHIVDTSAVSASHKDPVYDLYVVKSKSGTEFASCSTDGRVLWWDCRDLSKPTASMDLAISLDEAGSGSGAKTSRPGTVGTPRADSVGTPRSARHADGKTMLIGGTVLNIDPLGGAAKFLVGSEAGHILHCSRKTTPPEVSAALLAHHGPVKGICRSQFFGKYFMTCADWSVKLWADDIKTPILSTSYAAGTVTGCAFSNSRPGVFAATRSDGYLDIYDLYYKVDSPTLSSKLSSAALTSLEIDPTGEYTLVGSADGTILLVQGSEGLYSSPNPSAEKQYVQALLERESKREKSLEQRMKELKLRGAEKPQQGPRDLEKLIDPDTVQEIEDNYAEWKF